MSSAETQQIDPATLPPRLTMQRDADHLSPSPALVEARESGKWPEFKFFDPMVGGAGVLSAHAITTYSDGRQALSDQTTRMGVLDAADEGSTAGTPGFLIYLEGEEHRRVNKILARHFDAKRVKSLAPEVNAIVDGLLDELENLGGSADLVEVFTTELPARVTAALMGVPYEDAPRLAVLAEAQVDMNLKPEETWAAVAELKQYVADHYYEVKANPRDDLMSALAHDYEDELTEEEVIGVAFVIFSAAMDTSSRFGALAVLAILTHPEQYEIVRERGEVTVQMVDELLRFLSPATSAQQRRLTQDLTIGENTVKKGDRFMVSLLAANHDPELVGDNPGLDFNRPPVKHLAFSAGTHTCSGQHLLRLEMVTALSKLFQRFPTLEFAGNIDELGWLVNNQTYGITTLPVRW